MENGKKIYLLWLCVDISHKLATIFVWLRIEQNIHICYHKIGFLKDITQYKKIFFFLNTISCLIRNKKYINLCVWFNQSNWWYRLISNNQLTEKKNYTGQNASHIS